MTRLIIFIVYLVSLLSGFSQSIESIGKFPIGVRLSETAEPVTSENYSKIESKIVKVLSQHGYTTYGNCPFVCIPKLIINDVQKAEGGMKNVFLVDGTLQIDIINDRDGIIFTSVYEPVRGSATSEKKAVQNGLNSLTLKQFNSIIPSCRQKIIDYYRENLTLIINQARELAQRGMYDEGIAHVLTFPMEIMPEYEEALKVATEIYDSKIAYENELEEKRERAENDNTLVQARNALVARSPQEALQELNSFIMGFEDQDQQYYSIVEQANRLLAEAERKAEEKEKKAEEKEKQIYEDNKRAQEREYALRRQRMLLARQSESEKIEAMKQITLEIIRKK